MNPKNVWPTIVLALGAMGMTGGMAIAHVDRDLILLCVVSFIAPVLAALTVGQAAENRAATQAVQQTVNGNTSRLMDIIDRLGSALAASTPTAAEAATSPAPAAAAPPAVTVGAAAPPVNS